MNNNIFSIRFKETYKKRGYTQESLSEKTGIKKCTIAKYSKQSNYDLPSLETMKLLADTLEVDVAYLLGEIDCEHWQQHSVQEVTGLSPAAIKKLMEWKEQKENAAMVLPLPPKGGKSQSFTAYPPECYIDILSKLLENEKCDDLSEKIRTCLIQANINKNIESSKKKKKDASEFNALEKRSEVYKTIYPQAFKFDAIQCFGNMIDSLCAASAPR